MAGELPNHILIYCGLKQRIIATGLLEALTVLSAAELVDKVELLIVFLATADKTDVPRQAFAEKQIIVTNEGTMPALQTKGKKC